MLDNQTSIIRDCNQGTLKYLTKQFAEASGDRKDYEITSAKQIVPSKAIQLEFESKRTELERATKTVSRQMWYPAPDDLYDFIVEQGLFHGRGPHPVFYSNPSDALDDSVLASPRYLINCRVILGEPGTHYTDYKNRVMLKTETAIPNFAVAWKKSGAAAVKETKVAMAMKFCDECCEGCPSDSKFCPSCGHKF